MFIAVVTAMKRTTSTNHVLHFYGEVILVAHVVVDFVRVIWDVSDLFDVRCDSPVKSIKISELCLRTALLSYKS